ncbi:hypothetical protein A2U01_0069864, partial [Trifolium medium]|nr:hypothetical protein [Trifolium medium]
AVQRCAQCWCCVVGFVLLAARRVGVARCAQHCGCCPVFVLQAALRAGFVCYG